MQDFRILNDQALWLLWLVPILIAIVIVALIRKRTLLRRFADNDILRKINNTLSFKRQLLKSSLLILAVIAIIIALTQPGWNPKPEKVQQKGRDIVFLLDVSQSMLAEDIKPNRLERAKLQILDLLNVLEGDRVGIIAFAGTSVIKCPLTQDYGFVRMALADITTNSINRGGSLIGDAIRKATLEVFDQQQRDYKDIILITDGEDQDSYPEQAAEKAAQAGIRIFAIGLGDETEGRRIPIKSPNGEKTYLKYQGREVWTKLDGDTLRNIVYATPGGKYLPVSTGYFDLTEFYDRYIASSGQKELESRAVIHYEEKFQIFIALALALVFIETLISERKKAKI